MVDQDRVKGAAKSVGGEIQKETGKLTGDRAMEEKGRENKAEGAVDKAAGHTKEFLRGDKK